MPHFDMAATILKKDGLRIAKFEVGAKEGRGELDKVK
jgi:hypothetical protein